MMESPRRSGTDRLKATATLLVPALLLAWGHLQSQLVWQPASYDTLLYARSLWGLGSGNPFNPLYGTHALAIHANLAMLPLAPLAQVVHPVVLLCVAQALALAATVGLLHRALSPADRPPRRAMLLALTAGSLFFTGTFTFDPRPDVWAVPLLLAFWLRRGAQRPWQGVDTCLALGAVAVREELALALPGLVALPLPDPRSRLRAALTTALALAWFLTYWFALRPWLDADFADARAGQAADDLFGTGGADAWRWRAAVVFATLTLGGGALLQHPRWLAVAAPGLLWLLAIDKGGLEALRYHYPVFALPALLAGAVLAPPPATGTRRALAAGAGALQALMVLLWLWPRILIGHWIPESPGHAAALQEARVTLASLPPEAGVAGPYTVLGGVVNRPSVWSEETLLHALRTTGEVPADIDVVALPASERGRARFIVGRAGFRLAAPPGSLILLTPDQGPSPLQAEWLGGARPDAGCQDPIHDAPDVGVVVCQLTRHPQTGHLDALLLRRHLDVDPRPWTWVLAVPAGQMPLLVEDGLVLPSQLPVGLPVWARSEQPWPVDAPIPAMVRVPSPSARFDAGR